MLLASLLTLSHVPRWAIIDTTKTQTVADHSFRVAAICLTICAELEALNIPSFREQVLVKAITHDVEEAKSGDIPTPYKRKLASMGFGDDTEGPNFTDLIVKAADLLEAIAFVDRYVIRPDKIRPGLVTSLNANTDALYDHITQVFKKVPRSWLNRIINKILETGATYE